MTINMFWLLNCFGLLFNLTLTRPPKLFDLHFAFVLFEPMFLEKLKYKCFDLHIKI